MATINAFGGANPLQLAIGGTNATTASGARTSLGLTDISTQSTTNHYVLVGGSSNAVTSVTPSTSGFVLTSTGTSSDPSFQAFSGTGSMILISTNTFSSTSSLALTGLSTTYDVYVLNLSNIVMGTNAADILINYSTNNGSSYLSSNYVWVSTYSSSTAGATFSTTYNGTAPFATSGALTNYAVGLNSSPTYKYNATFSIYGLGSAATAVGFGFWSGSTAAVTWVQGRNDFSNTATAVNAIQLIPSSGNFASGTVSLYGIAK